MASLVKIPPLSTGISHHAKQMLTPLIDGRSITINTRAHSTAMHYVMLVIGRMEQIILQMPFEKSHQT